ncbi:hypothetical protein PHYPSEUDO_000835 [Phytophthora pseudosyringae]|uniref:Uncharacterized protein n=1 Tax=Phytophthora pseudosyringae TaxID=221518 RepID=A0A8T1WF97_9STRA|nr:hypothetical protein PHYPSEUDO_000835 [Phytophthora pseudosyringae]
MLDKDGANIGEVGGDGVGADVKHEGIVDGTGLEAVDDTGLDGAEEVPSMVEGAVLNPPQRFWSDNGHQSDRNNHERYGTTEHGEKWDWGHPEPATTRYQAL